MRILFLSTLLGFLLCVSVPAVSAQNQSMVAPLTPEPLTMERALEMALQGNPVLQATEAGLRAAEAEILTAGARPNPVALSDNGIAEYTYRVGFEQTFELGGKRRRRIDLAKSAYKLAEAEARHELHELKRELRQTYTQLYIAQQTQRLYESHLFTLDRALQTDKADALCRQRLVLQKARLQEELAGQTTQALQAGHTLNARMNQPLERQWAPATPERKTVPGENLDTLLETAVAQHPELTQGSLAMTQHMLELKRVKAERIPDFRLAAGPDMVFDDEPNFGAFIIAVMEVPIFDRKQGEIRKLEARREQLAYQQTAARRKIQLEVAELYTTIHALDQAIERYERVVIPESEKLTALSLEAITRGNCHQAVENLRATLDAQTEYLDLVERQQIALSELEIALGIGQEHHEKE